MDKDKSERGDVNGFVRESEGQGHREKRSLLRHESTFV